MAIVIFGLFPDLRPSWTVDGETVSVDMTSTIVLVMFVVGVIILFLGRPDVQTVPDQSVFKAGMISAIALFGIAWLTATFIDAHEEYIISTIGEWVTNWKFIFALAVFLVAALTTSQSTATRTIVPIGLAAGLPVGVVTGMWAGALGGVYTFRPTAPRSRRRTSTRPEPRSWAPSCSTTASSCRCSCCRSTTVAVGAAIGAIFF